LLLGRAVNPANVFLNHGNQDPAKSLRAVIDHHGAGVDDHDDALALLETGDEPIAVGLADDGADVSAREIHQCGAHGHGHFGEVFLGTVEDIGDDACRSQSFARVDPLKRPFHGFKGIPPDFLPDLVEIQVRQYPFLLRYDKACGDYSGGELLGDGFVERFPARRDGCGYMVDQLVNHEIVGHGVDKCRQLRVDGGDQLEFVTTVVTLSGFVNFRKNFLVGFRVDEDYVVAHCNVLGDDVLGEAGLADAGRADDHHSTLACAEREINRADFCRPVKVYPVSDIGHVFGRDGRFQFMKQFGHGVSPLIPCLPC